MGFSCQVPKRLPNRPFCGGYARAHRGWRGVDIVVAPSYLSFDLASRTVFRALF
jgi:hypothetical protein